ncbi:hypothetical protein EV714DRAFT_211747 [Schizophyllum commune]
MTRRKSLRGAAAPASVSEAGEPMEEDTVDGGEVQEEETPELTTGSGDATTPREGSSMNVDEQGPDEERAEREQQLWEAFRDEYFETIEQMPLHLQRQFTLMKELEQQAHSYEEDLLPTLRKYIARRYELASVPNPSPVQVEMATDSPPSAIPSRLSEQPSQLLRRSISRPPLTNGVSTSSIPITPLRRPTLEGLSTPRTPTPFGIPPERTKPPETTRQMLSHLAWLSEEIVHASEEKVHIAQAAYDSVDRHIRLIDQAIKEQEESITLGVRPGTRLAPVLLPDATQLVRPTLRDSMSPGVVQDPHAQDLELNGAEPAEDEQEQEAEADVEGDVQPPDGAVQKPKPRRHRPRISMPKRKKRAEPVSAPPPVEEPAIVTAPRKTSRPKKLTLLPASTDHIDEPLYCVCRGISAGTMVACDNPDCSQEWFHLPCVGLTEQPGDEEPWYCPACRISPNNSRAPKPRPRPRQRNRKRRR